MRYVPLLAVLVLIVVLMGSMGGGVERGLREGRNIVLVIVGLLGLVALLALIGNR